MLDSRGGKGEHSGIFQIFWRKALGCAERRVTKLELKERLPSWSRPVAGALEALAQHPSRPRRVPGGPVAGDWERSPLRSCAGTAREGEVPAVTGLLGQCLPRRIPWALGLALSVRTKSSLEKPSEPCWQRSQTALVHPGVVCGLVYIGRTRRRALTLLVDFSRSPQV